MSLHLAATISITAVLFMSAVYYRRRRYRNQIGGAAIVVHVAVFCALSWWAYFLGEWTTNLAALWYVATCFVPSTIHAHIRSPREVTPCRSASASSASSSTRRPSSRRPEMQSVGG